MKLYGLVGVCLFVLYVVLEWVKECENVDY